MEIVIEQLSVLTCPKNEMFKQLLLIFGLFLVILPKLALATEISCSDRYLTIINPIRDRSLWFDKSLKPLDDQINAINKNNFSATWLIQSDVLDDNQIIDKLNGMKRSEIGIFMEVSKDMAEMARVIYPYDTAWFDPNAVFLSGYNRSERQRLIDSSFGRFKQRLGNYPKVVGAWWIDSYSIQYMKQKYGIVGVMIVADQKTTDDYGVWGQWWGVAYYPSKINVLIPASNLQSKQDLVVVQWAQRDPKLAYGEGPKISNYSLQANDYIRQGKDTGYFLDIASSYLDCQNPIGQITVGLETGIESVDYIDEYNNQLNQLKKISSLNSVTLSEFFTNYKRVYPGVVDKYSILYKDSEWVLTSTNRENKLLKDKVGYNQELAFSDYFIADKEGFLNRDLTKFESLKRANQPSVYFVIITALFIVSYFARNIKIFIASLMFCFLSFGVIFKSGITLNREVFYGPVVDNLLGYQIFLPIIVYLLFSSLNFIVKKYKINLLYVSLIFGFIPVLLLIRYSFISGIYYLGFMSDALRFVGFGFKKPFEVFFVNQDFEGYLAAGFLKFPIEKIYTNWFLYFIFIPVTLLLLGIILSWILQRLPIRIRQASILILVVITFGYINWLFFADPLYVR